MNAFITAVSTFLPGSPVGNDSLAEYLGEVSKISAKTQKIILRNNGIKTRYYALERGTGITTHTNAQLAAEAIRLLPLKTSLPGGSIACLCCGTSSPDQIMPGHGSMVHGELDLGPCEVITTAGICLSGITALKHGAMSVALGMSHNAVATGSELASTFLRNDFFQTMTGKVNQKTEEGRHPAFSFEAEFLRWMLSDGAGAVLITREPVKDRLCLRIDWIETVSHAHLLEPCMYAGAVKQEDGGLVGWRECVNGATLEKQGVMTIKQDARLLNQEIIESTVAKSLPSIIKKHDLAPTDVDWFLPHYSSDYFRRPLDTKMKEIGFSIPDDRWFTNLRTKGNTGSASFYIMLDELYSSGQLRKGDRILGMVPAL